MDVQKHVPPTLNYQMRIEPLGDSALLVRVVEEFNADESLDAVLGVTQQIAAAKIGGIIELAPAYTTVGVFFDPTRTGGFDEIRSEIERALGRKFRPTGDRTAATIDVPVCYENEFAADLDEVARHSGLSPEEVVSRHSGAKYRVSCVGFTPGFPYLSGLPPELATPRRASPRKEIPAGAVAIGGTQTGIYPRKSPGGWNVIGRTPLRLFDHRNEPPAVLRAGDSIRFREISREEFEHFSA
jgi:inhibitor of KinA